MPKHAGRLCWCALALLTSPGCSSAKGPCTPANLAPTAAECVARIHACMSVECVDQAQLECNAKGDAQCQQ